MILYKSWLRFILYILGIFQTTVETLKKQVKEELHNRTVLNARINSDSAESEKFEDEAREKKNKVQAKKESCKHYKYISEFISWVL